MRVKQRLRRLLDDKSPGVEKASKIEKGAVYVDAIGRIADLKETGAQILIEVKRISSDGGGFRRKHYDIATIDPATFRELIGTDLGGGNFTAEFRKSDNQLMLRTDNGKPESVILDVGGKIKGQEKAEKAEKKKDEVPAVYQMMMERQDKNLELVITALKGNGANGQTSEIIKAAKEINEMASGGAIDPVQFTSTVIQLANQLNQNANRAPVQTTGSTSTGIEKFFEGLGAAIPAFAPTIAARLNPGTADPAGVLPANTDPTAKPDPGAFAGVEGAHSPSAPPSTTTPGQIPNPQIPNPIDALSAPLGPVKGAPGDPRVAAYGAIIKLRYLIEQRDDPYSIAGEIIDSINLIAGAQRIGGRWQNFINEENAGTLFDQYAPAIPEFAADPDYMAECRAALLEVIQEHLNPESQSEEEEHIEAADEVDHTTVESEAVSDGTTAEDDRTA